MDSFVGPRKSGKTTRAILWMLQNWDNNGVIVVPHHSIERTQRFASALTNLHPVTFEDRITCPPMYPGLLHPDDRYLLDDIQDFEFNARAALLSTGRVVAYTECRPSH